MVNLTLNRKTKTKDSVLGKLLLDDRFFCYTLENLALSISADVFEVKMLWSEHFQRNIPHLIDVPDRTAIEIHPGNAATDSRGCILVGYKEGNDNIRNSCQASDDLNFTLQDEQDAGFKITITVNDIPDGTGTS